MGYILWANFGKFGGGGGGGAYENPFRGWGMDIFRNHTLTIWNGNLS